MSFIVQNLLDEALRLIHVLRANQTYATAISNGNTIPGSQEYQMALDGLNQLLDGFSVGGDTIFQVVSDSKVLTGVAGYTFGPGGDINAARPIKIRAAAISTSDGQMPVKIVDIERFQATIDTTATGAYADLLFCDYAIPVANVYLTPAPLSGGTLHLNSYKAFASAVYLSDALSLPTGYLETIKFNLAVSLASEFAGAVLEQWVIARAGETRQRLAQLNAVTIGAPDAPLGRVPFQAPLMETDFEQGKPATP